MSRESREAADHGRAYLLMMAPTLKPELTKSLEMDEEMTAWFRHVVDSIWLTPRPLRLVGAQRGADGIWRLGDVQTDDAGLAAARPTGAPLDAKGFEFVHGGWRVAAFRLFRPLAYFAAFGPLEAFDCLELAVGSLVKFGRWRYEVLVLTSAESVEIVRTRLAPLDLGSRLHVAAVKPAADRLDWSLARYLVDTHPVLHAAQPILYLDVDIVCDKPLEPLLAQLVLSSMIHACKEGEIGEGSPQSGGYWFGWRLLAADEVPFDPDAWGFSSGVLGAANATVAERAFGLINKVARSYVEEVGERERLISFDQRFANYVLFKLCTVEIEMLTQVVNLFRIPAAGVPHPAPEGARGLVHFLGESLAVKRDAMRSYVAALRDRS